ncbi:MAG: carbon storage regulator [Bryobacterales bacterium]|nr:carbon storage regulator [Bryobacterales bacterium]MBV9400659.1 carbon storage regulator [Bryobacterales bacterium]
MIRRRPGEAVLIGEGVEVEVLEATVSQVKLGIRAPRSVPVLRKEIQITRQQNREAAREIPPVAIRRLSACLKDPASKSYESSR